MAYHHRINQILKRNPHMQDIQKLKRRWRSMWHRCYTPHATGYKNYGGRGITICDRWHVFENFFEDMGYPPFEGATLERLDNNREYSKENCVWASRQTQSVNRRTTRWVEDKPLKYKAQELNVTPGLLRRNLDEGFELNYRKGWHGPPKKLSKQPPACALSFITWQDIPLELTKAHWCYVFEIKSLGDRTGVQATYYRKKKRQKRYKNKIKIYYIFRWRCMGVETDLGRTSENETWEEFCLRKFIPK